MPTANQAAPWSTERTIDGQTFTVHITLGVVKASGTIRVDATEITITGHGTPITATIWRKISPWSLVRQALEENDAVVDRLVDEQIRPGLTGVVDDDGEVRLISPVEEAARVAGWERARTRLVVPRAARGQRRGQLTDDELREVAAVYLGAKREAARKAVAVRFTVSVATAGRWVLAARRAGYLPSRTPYRGGDTT
ncbi:MAG: hypothetical protein ACYCXA_11120 [Actinomycetes bacterium]